MNFSHFPQFYEFLGSMDEFMKVNGRMGGSMDMDCSNPATRRTLGGRDTGKTVFVSDMKILLSKHQTQLIL